ncbi:MAG: phosphoheptose isomerase [Candidatus Yanofskybacteria bacterium RIFCSPHIGHO2_02_FULL_41_11]|uniref:Phosphoheptose isomerase n=1 Tax=Candidatus Yanofskybacteria bacterium RIFCSPHIGHO2_02_FULL_41_11 TaxID=1802675 RepID=A0A1F8F9M8_9BACT|nr:MAG: phosphoheptose isomerase [Candidatus Yanofskybacteria bacterium RIFCSPHIGHO2_02_FULL_41_11]
MVKNPEILARIDWAGSLLVSTLQRGNKILIAGNGGSAADAQHFAAELAGKFVLNRKGLPAIALTANSSIVTAIANDFGYEHVFSRQVEALIEKDDIFVGISTSGNSKNILLAAQTARQLGGLTIGILGNDGGEVNQYCDISIIVPSTNTQAIQESHVLIIHIICSIVDEAFGL